MMFVATNRIKSVLQNRFEKFKVRKYQMFESICYYG